MRRVMALAASAAFALPAAAQVAPSPFVTVMPDTQGVPATVLDAVQRLPATPALEAPLRSAPCAFADSTRHLDRLASNLPWAQPAAVVLFDGLPGLPPGRRAVVLRPTRELLARAATREVIAQGGVSLHAIDLSPLPVDAPTPSFIALHIAPPETPPEGCVAQPPR
ncbi:hypothetical protein ROS9278_03020 [Roseomonas sp. CECT 9278]|nr:hypothetical protein ROS9278_03020 [Roseomonas sp. CECT 9278]